MLSGKLYLFLPVRNDLLFPLPFNYPAKIIRPGTGYPVRMLGSICITRAAGKGDDPLYP